MCFFLFSLFRSIFRTRVSANNLSAKLINVIRFSIVYFLLKSVRIFTIRRRKNKLQPPKTLLNNYYQIGRFAAEYCCSLHTNTIQYTVHILGLCATDCIRFVEYTIQILSFNLYVIVYGLRSNCVCVSVCYVIYSMCQCLDIIFSP